MPPDAIIDQSTYGKSGYGLGNGSWMDAKVGTDLDMRRGCYRLVGRFCRMRSVSLWQVAMRFFGGERTLQPAGGSMFSTGAILVFLWW